MRKKGEFCASADDHIPTDVLLQIICKLPIKSLIRFSCASKFWYNLLNNDQHFHKLHFFESQKKPILMFTFQDFCGKRRLYYLEKEEEHGNNTHKNKLLVYQKKDYSGFSHMVGYCNGLACYSTAERYDGETASITLEIHNDCRHEALVIVSSFKSRAGERLSDVQFGYDLLNNEYKVMCILECNGEHEYYILTLGGRGTAKPWRKINNPWPKQRPWSFESYSASSTGVEFTPAISCNNSLFYEMVKDETQVEACKRLALVAFDLHGEKFQIVEFPDDEEFVLNYNRRPRDFYRLEYKGCLCYSRVEKIEPYKGKVVLHMLTDTVEHVWSKETIEFDLPRELENPPVRTSTMIFSDQVVLYWRLRNKENRRVLSQFYNVHSKEFKEVKVPNKRYRNCYEYFISSHVENFLSLKTLATVTGVGNTSELLKEYKKNSNLLQDLFKATVTGVGNTSELLEEYKKNSNLRQDLLKGVTTSNSQVISFLDSTGFLQSK